MSTEMKSGFTVSEFRSGFGCTYLRVFREARSSSRDPYQALMGLLDVWDLQTAIEQPVFCFHARSGFGSPIPDRCGWF